MEETVVKSLGELLAEAGINTLIGMGTVFLVLIFISLIIYCFKFINRAENKIAAKKTDDADAPVAMTAETVPESDDLELVSVIAAAIASYEHTSADGFVVRSIRKRK